MVNAQKWKKWTIGELISRTKTTIQTGPFGTVLSASEFVDYGIPIISVREIREGFIRITAETPCITDGTYSRLRKYALSEKDIVFARKGSVERSALIPIGLERYFLGSDGIRIRFDQNIVSPDLMLYLFQSPSTKQFLIQSSYGTTMAGLNEKILCALEFYLPETVDEQKRIAKVLTDIDHLLALTEKLIAKKKAIKQGVMQELLTGKHRLPGFSGEWETFVFGDLFDFISNNAFTRAQLSVSGKVKNIHYGDILTKFGTYISADSNEIPYIKKEIDLSRFAEKCYLQSGDVVIADTAEDETGGQALEVINVECPVLAGQHTLLCRPKVRFAVKFLGYYLNAACYHDQLLPFIVGTKVSSISKASIAQTKLIVPKYEEQRAISCILSDMDDEIAELEQKLAKYRQVKQGMMQQLLAGKVRLV